MTLSVLISLFQLLYRGPWSAVPFTYDYDLVTYPGLVVQMEHYAPPEGTETVSTRSVSFLPEVSVSLILFVASLVLFFTKGKKKKES